MANNLMNTYGRLPITVDFAQGAYVWDTDGKRYLDALSGIAVCSLGHAHPAVAKAVSEQAHMLVHTSNLYHIPQQEKLATDLCKLAKMDSVFFGNSGAEANEAAIKLARLYGHKKGIQNPQIIVTDGSFHGRTMATLSATGNRKIQAGFEPLVQGFLRVPYNDVETIKNVAEMNQNVVAILVEPVQGEGGINIPDADYLTQLRQICDDNGWLLMLDEIQTGMGRTGKWFAHQHAKIIPDVMTLAKALGNGLPIGACLAKGGAAKVLQPGTHGSTYGGNPLVCAAAQAVVDTMSKEKTPAAAARMGTQLVKGFSKTLAGQTGITDIRGLGMMIAIELDRPCAALVKLAADAGLLINVTAGNVVRLLPPLNLKDKEAKALISELSVVITDFLNHNNEEAS